MPEVMVRVKIDQNGGMRKRQCSCTIGQYDEKTGKLIPARELASNQVKPPKYVMVPMKPEIANEEMRNAQLGRSEGIKTKMDGGALNKELDGLLLG